MSSSPPLCSTFMSMSIKEGVVSVKRCPTYFKIGTVDKKKILFFRFKFWTVQKISFFWKLDTKCQFQSMSMSTELSKDVCLIKINDMYQFQTIDFLPPLFEGVYWASPKRWKICSLFRIIKKRIPTPIFLPLLTTDALPTDASPYLYMTIYLLPVI